MSQFKGQATQKNHGDKVKLHPQFVNFANGKEEKRRVRELR